MWFGAGWVGTDMNAMLERNAEIIKAQKEAALLAKTEKCGICRDTESELKEYGGSLPHLACVDVLACDKRWLKLLPITN